MSSARRTPGTPARPKGWTDVCYEFFVDRDGDVWEGRAGALAGPVVADATGGSQGFAQLVCLLGDFTDADPDGGVHWTSLVKVLAWLAGSVRHRHRARRDDHVRLAWFAALGGRRHGDDADHRRPPRHVVHGVPRRPALRPAAGDPQPRLVRAARGVARAVLRPAARLGVAPVASSGARRPSDADLDRRRARRRRRPGRFDRGDVRWPAPDATSSSSTRPSFPRDKCCGDGLTTLALRELEPLGLDPAMVPNWQSVDAAWLRSPSGREVVLPLPDDGQFAATAPRRELDAALVDLARAAGRRRARRPRGRRRASRDADDRSSSTVDGIGTVAARYLVAADGMWSPVRKALGLAEPGYLGEWHALPPVRQRCHRPGRATACTCGSRPTCCPATRGASRCPTAGSTSASACCATATRNGAGHARRCGPTCCDRPHIAAALGADVELEGRHTAWPIPAGIDRATLADGRVLFVGDAAMATDTMTGEGIGQARAHRPPRRRGDRRRRRAAAGRRGRRATSRTGARHLFADHRMSVAAQQGCWPRAAAPAGRCASSTSATGAAATSPGGCSRTSPARSPSRRAAGTASVPPAPARSLTAAETDTVRSCARD